MSNIESLVLKSNSEQVFFRLYNALEERRYEEVASLFSPKGKWRRFGQIYVGPDEILSALSERSASIMIRHLITNFLVLRSDSNQLVASAYLLVYSADANDNNEKPVRASSPRGVYVANASFVRKDGEVRIASLCMEQDFSFS